MNRKIFISLFLCVAMLLPSDSAAQFFAKQKVVVWAVMDRNTDVKVAEGTKTQIRTSIVDAFVNSRNYEAFEANLDDVKSRVGQSMSPIAIAKAVKAMYGVDYVLFTTIKILQHSTSYDNFQVHLSSDLFSAETQKSERMAYVDMRSDVNEIPGACAKLLSDLLGEQLAVASQPAQQPTQPQQTYQQPTYQPKTAGKKVGDLVYHNGAPGIVVVLYDDAGEHGLLVSAEQTQCYWSAAKSWCANLGSGWKLPSKSQLLMIYRNKDKINAALEARGWGVLHKAYYWSSDEYDADCAWFVLMYDGRTGGSNKYNLAYVRAVSAF